ncbi:MAG: hypothetical protein Q3M30_04840 [Candidatus Electrothrix sp. Rat3]|nr:hypothetical protein [Candidatus Electrothrix rattekaaiensis]
MATPQLGDQKFVVGATGGRPHVYSKGTARRAPYAKWVAETLEQAVHAS